MEFVVYSHWRWIWLITSIIFLSMPGIELGPSAWEARSLPLSWMTCVCSYNIFGYKYLFMVLVPGRATFKTLFFFFNFKNTIFFVFIGSLPQNFPTIMHFWKFGMSVTGPSTDLCQNYVQVVLAYKYRFEVGLSDNKVRTNQAKKLNASCLVSH